MNSYKKEDDDCEEDNEDNSIIEEIQKGCMINLLKTKNKYLFMENFYDLYTLKLVE